MHWMTLDEYLEKPWTISPLRYLPFLYSYLSIHVSTDESLDPESDLYSVLHDTQSVFCTGFGINMNKVC